MYLNGYGVEKDYETAMKWFRLAADQGDGLAQLQLGHLYYEGTGVSQDLVQTHMWFSLAAMKGAKGAAFLRAYMAKSMTATQRAQARQLVREWKPKTNDLSRSKCETAVMEHRTTRSFLLLICTFFHSTLATSAADFSCQVLGILDDKTLVVLHNGQAERVAEPGTVNFVGSAERLAPLPV